MKLKLTEYVEATNEEIGDAFGQMNAGEQADLIQALEVGLIKHCQGDVSDINGQYIAIEKELKLLDVKGIKIDPKGIES